MRKLYILFYLICLLSFTGLSQPISVSLINSSDTALFQELLGNGCTSIFEINYVGDPVSFGYFSTTSSNFDLHEGIVLSNGKALEVSGPNNNPNTSWITTGGTDSLLLPYVIPTNNDAARFEYSFRSYLNEYTLKFIYGSEEYPDFMHFTDPMGFFVSGPMPSGGNYENENIALIPGTSTPVNSYTINQYTNNQYFIFNGNGTTPSNEAIQFDGYTTVFSANFPVIPGEIYDVIIVIADGKDSNYDSGVFFISDTLITKPINYHFELESNYGSSSHLFEGYNANLKLVRNDSSFINYGLNVNLETSGSAIQGQDYNLIDSIYIIPAGQMSINIPLSIYYDFLTEQTESITFSENHICSIVPDLTISIYNDYFLEAGIDNDSLLLCEDFNIIPTFSNSVDSLLNFIWSTGDTTSYLEIINDSIYSQTYYVTISHDFGVNDCIDSIFIQHTQPLIIVLTPVEYLCSIGSINMEFTGGMASLNIEWSNGSSSQNLVNVPPDVYSVIITDNLGCEQSDSIQIFSEPGLEIDFSLVSNCEDSIVDIISIVNYGYPPYSYLWNTLDTIQMLDSVPSGTYIVTVSDSIGCEKTDSITFSPDTLVVILNTNDISCEPGSAILSLTGNPPYIINWSTGEGGLDSIQFYETGLYAVEVEDITSCVYYEEFFISNNPQLLIDISSTIENDPCVPNGGSIEIIITNGIGPFIFNWSNGDTTAIISNLSSGNYILTVTSYDGCMGVWEFEVSDFEVFDYNLIVNNITDCNTMNNGSANVNCNGGILPYSYNWSNSSTTQSVSNLSNQIYYVTISDACGIQFVDSVSLDYDYSLQFNIEQEETICNTSSGEISISEVNGEMFLSYLYDESNQLISSSIPELYENLLPQTYILVLEDSYGCLLYDTILVNNVSGDINLMSFPPQANCNGDSVNLICEVSGLNNNYQYDISILPLVLEEDTGTVISPFVNDNYHGSFPLDFDFVFFGEIVSEYYIGGNGWVSFSPLSSPSYDPWVTQPIPNTDPSRPRNAILAPYRDLNPNLGTISHYISGLPPNRKLIVSYSSVPLMACSNTTCTFQVVIHESSNIIDINHVNVPTCPTWNSGNGVLGIQNASGTLAYSVPGKNNTQWTSFNTTYRFIPRQHQWFDTNNNLFSIEWSPYLVLDSSQTIYCSTSTCAGLVIDSLFIPVLGNNDQFDLGYDTILCYGDILSIYDNNLLSYEWSNGTTTNSIVVEESGLFSLTTTDGGCDKSDSVFITVENTFPIPLYDTSLCDTSLTYISFDSSYTYFWSNGSTDNSFYLNLEGEYSFTMTSANCIIDSLLYLQLSNSPEISLNLNTNICGYQTILNPGISDSYLWSNGYAGQNLFVGESGIYSVTMSNDICSSNAETFVSFFPVFDINLFSDTIICDGQTSYIDFDIGYPSYQWNTADTNSYIFISNPGVYSLTVTNINGCESSDSVNIELLPIPLSLFSFDEAFGTVQFYNESQYATNYMWYFGDGSGIFTENPVHTYPSLPNNEFYTVTLIANNMCGTDTSELELIIFDIEGVDLHDGINIYPNPFKDEFTVKGLSPDAKIKIFDILGKEQIFEITSYLPYTVSLRNNDAGLYFIMIEREKDVSFYKVVKQ